MTRRENEIVYENPKAWVSREIGSYIVWRIGVTCSTSDSAYEKTDDGLSIAKARCDYLARKGAQ